MPGRSRLDRRLCWFSQCWYTSSCRRLVVESKVWDRLLGDQGDGGVGAWQHVGDPVGQGSGE